MTGNHLTVAFQGGSLPIEYIMRSTPTTCRQNISTGSQNMPLVVMGIFSFTYSLTLRLSLGICGKRLLSW